MNKRDKRALAALAAKWEWPAKVGCSVSEAMAMSACRSDILACFKLDAEELNFARAWEIATRAGIEDDDRLFDELCGRIESDYTTLVDLVEEIGFSGLRKALEAGSERRREANNRRRDRSTGHSEG